MKFKAIAVDIDGTITFRDRSLDMAAIGSLRSLDVPVVLSTGNVLCYAHAAARLIGVGGIVIAENGGVISPGFDTVPIVSESIRECQKAFDLLSGKFELTKLDPEHRKTEIVLRRDFDLELARQILYEHGPNVEIIDTHFAIHIKSRGVNKGTGLIKVAELMGIEPKDFVAIGDSVNDVEMLEMAGFGIAVGNGDPELRSVADYTAASPYGAGAAEGITYLREHSLI
ncbi:MAG: Phosphoglycolate phosphatase [Methanomethylovorans sp. PtaU1.Bin093]|jgi:phosphoglycolate phosphatase (TIGR01487 family)|uniref:phosphoglycolate phosphatase n=1 Tax=Methanomethylovorans sp. PtaU1.Bin093 TaxID=1811679 RepID=UPI0009D10782|nr:phosphoglycolate phosphatase [Methanomethylovorans sp. PtaU1.Bin093]OPY21557.1 MAG: Phosphoglycolate phosphatase [Methanomethylovorans sp. PtaU1.Bin093]